MVRVSEIFDFLNEKAPVETKMDFDNVGLLVGRGQAQVSRVLVALDITGEVISEAERLGAELIVSHHPLFFSLKSVTDTDTAGKNILRIAEGRRAAICMHTNLDAAAGGVNDELASALGLEGTAVLCSDGIGRYGTLPSAAELSDFLVTVKTRLNSAGLRYYGAGRPVHRIAVVGGSGGGDLMRAAELGCDTLVTADVKYDQFLSAKELGINLIDADHFCTENVVCPALKSWLETRFPALEVTISAIHGQTARFI